jgi:hypothetical protein
MTDEQIWLLRYGRGWVHWYDLANETGDDLSKLAERMHEARMLESDHARLCVRLKPKEENEPIRV